MAAEEGKKKEERRQSLLLPSLERMKWDRDNMLLYARDSLAYFDEKDRQQLIRWAREIEGFREFMSGAINNDVKQELALREELMTLRKKHREDAKELKEKDLVISNLQEVANGRTNVLVHPAATRLMKSLHGLMTVYPWSVELFCLLSHSGVSSSLPRGVPLQSEHPELDFVQMILGLQFSYALELMSMEEDREEEERALTNTFSYRDKVTKMAAEFVIRMKRDGSLGYTTLVALHELSSIFIRVFQDPSRLPRVPKNRLISDIVERILLDVNTTAYRQLKNKGLEGKVGGGINFDAPSLIQIHQDPSSNDTMNSMRDEIAALKKQIRETNSNNGKLTEKVARLTRRRAEESEVIVDDESQSVSQEAQAFLQEMARDIDKRLGELQEKERRLEIRKRSLDRKEANLTERAQSLEEGFAKLDIYNASTEEDEREGEESFIQRFSMQLLELETEKQDLEEWITSLKKQIEDADDEHTKTQRELGIAERRVSTLEKELKAEKEASKKLRDDLEDVGIAMNTAQKGLEGLGEKTREQKILYGNQSRKLMEQNRELEKERDSLVAQLGKAKEALNQKRAVGGAQAEEETIRELKKLNNEKDETISKLRLGLGRSKAHSSNMDGLMRTNRELMEQNEILRTNGTMSPPSSPPTLPFDRPEINTSATNFDLPILDWGRDEDEEEELSHSPPRLQLEGANQDDELHRLRDELQKLMRQNEYLEGKITEASGLNDMSELDLLQAQGQARDLFDNNFDWSPPVVRYMSRDEQLAFYNRCKEHSLEVDDVFSELSEHLVPKDIQSWRGARSLTSSSPIPLPTEKLRYIHYRLYDDERIPTRSVRKRAVGFIRDLLQDWKTDKSSDARHLDLIRCLLYSSHVHLFGDVLENVKKEPISWRDYDIDSEDFDKDGYSLLLFVQCYFRYVMPFLSALFDLSLYVNPDAGVKEIDGATALDMDLFYAIVQDFATSVSLIGFKQKEKEEAGMFLPSPKPGFKRSLSDVDWEGETSSLNHFVGKSIDTFLKKWRLVVLKQDLEREAKPRALSPLFCLGFLPQELAEFKWCVLGSRASMEYLDIWNQTQVFLARGFSDNIATKRMRAVKSFDYVARKLNEESGQDMSLWDLLDPKEIEDERLEFVVFQVSFFSFYESMEDAGSIYPYLTTKDAVFRDGVLSRHVDCWRECIRSAYVILRSNALWAKNNQDGYDRAGDLLKSLFDIVQLMMSLGGLEEDQLDVFKRSLSTIFQGGDQE